MIIIESNRKLFFIALLIIIVGSSLFYGRQIFSYDTKTAHPFLVEKAVDLFNEGSENKLSDQEMDWIRQGSVDEDMPFRWMNHFLNPNTRLGLPGFSPANIWAESGLLQATYLIGDQTWNTAIAAYNSGDKKFAFTALGHILHLMQDMAVPAHTKNDPHANGDPYEQWVENNSSVKYEKTELIRFDELNSYFNSLAVYSNKYFLSEDITKIVENFKYSEEIINNKIYLIIKDDQEKKFKLVEKKIVVGKIDYILNDSVHSDYYSLLAPKAISYGAGVIDLFFKQADEKKAKKVSIIDKLKQNLSKVNGILVNGTANFFKAYASSVDYYYHGISDNITPDANLVATPLQITVQQKSSGRVLSASESASSADKRSVVDEQIIKPVAAPNAVKPAAAPVKKQTAIAAIPVVQQLMVNNKPAVKSAPAVKQNLDKPNVIEPETQILKIPDASPAISVSEKQTEKTVQTENSQQSQASGIQPDSVSMSGVQDPPQPKTHRKGCGGIAPETTIISYPDSMGSSTHAVFVFVSNQENSVFECDLDSAGWIICSSSHVLSNLPNGTHNMKVRAIDEEGNIDQTPAEHSWTIDTVSPVVSISGNVQYISTSTTADFNIVSNENETNFICQSDMNQWQECLASTTISNLIDGWHILEVNGIDAAGNTGSSTAISWLVDATAPQSSVSALNQTYESTGFSINWSGTDGSASTTSGLAYFDIQYKIDAGPPAGEAGQWQDWIVSATTTNAIFDLPASNGQTVYFRSRAVDFAGNIENWPENENGDVNTIIAELPPAPSVIEFSNTSFAFSNWKSSFSWKHTVNGGNPVLIVSLHSDNGWTPNSVTYNDQPLTLKIKKFEQNNYAVSIYYLANPPQGEHDLKVNIGSQTKIFAASAATFLNCDTDNPIGLAVSSHQAAKTMTQSVNTNINGMMLIDAVTYDKYAPIPMFVGSGQTQYFSQHETSVDGAWFSLVIDLYAGQSYKLAEQAGSHPMSWIMDSERRASHVIVGLNPKQ